MFGAEDFENCDIEIQQEIEEELQKEAGQRARQEIPGAAEETAQTPPAQNEAYGDFIVKYVQNLPGAAEAVSDESFLTVNESFGVLYVPLAQLREIEITSYSYNAIPKCYTYMDTEALNASGITRLQNHPYLKLLGQGTAVAVVDSGIDYRNPVFQNSGGSRILYLWDQTLEGERDARVPYGRLFTKEDIDQALALENPLEIVPSMDYNGHGTALAAIAAGNAAPEEDFSGAAPEASLIVVKLKQAKTYLREFYLYPENAEIFQENDVMLGVAYAARFAREAEMPLSVCLGIGSSQGAHEGTSPLCQYLDYLMGFARISVSVAAGNEGNARHHYTATLSPQSREATAELRVAERESGFTMELWGSPPETYVVSVQSPTGETLEVSRYLGTGTQTLSFVFVETKLLVNYVAIERQTGNPLVYFRFLHPAAGIWKIRVRMEDGQTSQFHIWLPVTGLISADTYFLESSPYNTVTSPGDARESITMTAYQYRDNSLYLNASRGFTPQGIVTPQLSAPGVGIKVPLLTGGFGEASGTSLATAQAAGTAALLFEWAVIRENERYFSGTNIKNYLQRGARREEGTAYPNPEWGYGRMDLYRTFQLLT